MSYDYVQNGVLTTKHRSSESTRNAGRFEASLITIVFFVEEIRAVILNLYFDIAQTRLSSKPYGPNL